MTNLQAVKKFAKSHGLAFKPTNSKINGAKLYNFVNDFNTVIASNWTVSSAYNELVFGDLESKII